MRPQLSPALLFDYSGSDREGDKHPRLRLGPSARDWFCIAALLSLWSLEAKDGSGEPVQAGHASGTPSSQTQSAIEAEGVFGATGAGVDTERNSIVAYQTGIFKSRMNAARLIDKLGKDDFAGFLCTRMIIGTDYWVVLVPSANNPFENRSGELLQAGFPSLPVRKRILDAENKLVPEQ